MAPCTLLEKVSLDGLTCKPKAWQEAFQDEEDRELNSLQCVCKIARTSGESKLGCIGVKQTKPPRAFSNTELMF